MRLEGSFAVAAVAVSLGLLGLLSPPPAAAAAWCGAASAADRPDTVGGSLVHVVYAVPADGPDRLPERAAGIATDIGLVADWWRLQDATREPRFDLTAVPGCGTRFGQLDITTIRVPSPAASFAAPDGRLVRLLSELSSTLDESHKKYLVFFDSPVNLEGDVCGTAFTAPRTGGAPGSGAVWLAPNTYGFGGCGTLGNGGYVAVAAAHELIHALGALDSVSSPGPPHACPGDPGHPCDSSADILSLSGFSESLFDYALDVGRDDYYAHSGTWWDVQDSAWLAHLNAGLRRVSATIAGGGAGSSIRSTPSGLACPPICVQDFDSDLPIEMAAEPGEGFEFAGWSGDCSGQSCSVPLGRSVSLAARFVPIRWRFTVRVVGRGRVTSRPRGVVSCPGRCRGSLAFGTTLRLSAAAARGYRFVGWRGDCQGRGPCVIEGADSTITAVFRR